jgi:DNA-directed RNA polymerase specialized sigma24 family protein
MDFETSSIELAGVPITAEGILAFNAVWPDLAGSMRRFARIISSSLDDQADLVQEAMIKLWQVDPARYELGDPKDVAYLRRVLIHHMYDVWGSEPLRFRNSPDSLARATGPSLSVVSDAT